MRTVLAEKDISNMKNRNLLMIPGPIEFEPAVLAEMGAPTSSHIAPDFIEAFGKVLENLLHVFLSQTVQSFVRPVLAH